MIINCDDHQHAKFQQQCQRKKQNQGTVQSGVIFNPYIKKSQCHSNFTIHPTQIADSISTNTNTQQSIQLGKLLNDQFTKPFGPKIGSLQLNNKSIEGDKLFKYVNFEELHCLCQYIRDSPPKSFKNETTPVLFDLNDC